MVVQASSSMDGMDELFGGLNFQWDSQRLSIMHERNKSDTCYTIHHGNPSMARWSNNFSQLCRYQCRYEVSIWQSEWRWWWPTWVYLNHTNSELSSPNAASKCDFWRSFLLLLHWWTLVWDNGDPKKRWYLLATPLNHGSSPSQMAKFGSSNLQVFQVQTQSFRGVSNWGMVSMIPKPTQVQKHILMDRTCPRSHDKNNGGGGWGIGKDQQQLSWATGVTSLFNGKIRSYLDQEEWNKGFVGFKMCMPTCHCSCLR